MRLEDECRLSYYKQIGSFDDEHNVYFVQNITDRKVYVKKILTIYNLEVFRYLQGHPIPNMPHIYEVVVDANKLIVIEEYMSGTTLKQMLDEKKSLSEDETINIICQLCAILDMLHNAHPPIVHRDIKPSNIIISSDGVVKLIDMNAAKWSRNTVGQDTMLMGTAGYAAPEQYGFAVSNTKTDIYSVGVLINVMLTGGPPVEQLAREPMGHIVSRCTKMDPKERYESIADVCRAVHACQRKMDDALSERRYRYAPPGFRTLNPLSIISSAIGYLLVCFLGFSITVNSDSKAVLWLNRIIFTFVFIAIIFFWGNYMGIQQKLRVPFIRKPLFGFLLKILFSISIFVVGIFILAILEQFIR